MKIPFSHPLQIGPCLRQRRIAADHEKHQRILYLRPGAMSISRHASCRGIGTNMLDSIRKAYGTISPAPVLSKNAANVSFSLCCFRSCEVFDGDILAGIRLVLRIFVASGRWQRKVPFHQTLLRKRSVYGILLLIFWKEICSLSVDPDRA